MSIELGTVQTGSGKVDPARKFKCTTAAHGIKSYMFLIITPFIEAQKCFEFLICYRKILLLPYLLMRSELEEVRGNTVVSVI